MTFISFFGMLAGIAVLILLIYKGFHALPVAIISSLVVILTSGLDIWGSLVNGPDGSWASTMAANISRQPASSRTDRPCPRSTQPASALNTLSSDMRSDATVGSVSFCATICSV